MRISDWSSDVCSSDLVALRCCPAQYLDLAGVKAEPFVNARDLRLAGALVGQKDPRWAALDDRRGDRTGLDIGEALRGEHHARILLAQRLEPFAKLRGERSEEHTSELQSLMRISYAVFCLKKKNNKTQV